MAILKNAVVAILPMMTFLHGALSSGEEPSQTPIVPQTLLKLIHAPEVQKELGFEKEDEKLLAVLREIDGPWWRSRILPEEKQQAVVAEIEKQLLTELKGLLANDKIKRLREIEVQSQGTRSLLRSGIAKAVGLTSKQSDEIQKTFLDTDKVARKLVGNPKDRTEVEKELNIARENEKQKLNSILNPANRLALTKLIGKPFDTAGLKRIYPLAPELIDSGEWTGGEPTTLADQRGKVVLVHFYAFQCHNCVANFDHYNRWQQTLVSRGVTVIGIQTPETSAERNVSLVRRQLRKRFSISRFG